MRRTDLSLAPHSDKNACRTVRKALRMATHQLAAAGVPDAAVDARHLVAHALGIERAALLRAPERALDTSAQERISGMIARRMAREPVSRIIGERDFYGLTLTLADGREVVFRIHSTAGDIVGRCLESRHS